MQETQVQSLDQEDSLEKGMATHPSIFAWRIPWTEEPGGLQSMGSQSQDLPYQNGVSEDWARTLLIVYYFWFCELVSPAPVCIPAP